LSPAGAGAGGTVQRLCRDLDILAEVYRKFLVEAVDDKIKQVLFLYLAVCLGRLHTAPKQTLTLTRCDRLMFDLLYEEPQTASDIAKSLDMSVQNAKYHLDKLEEAGLIEIIDIWYSDRGREMNVYAPTSSSIILFAGNSNEKRSLRKILKQSLGITGILGIASFLFGWVLSNLRPETIVDTDTDPKSCLGYEKSCSVSHSPRSHSCLAGSLSYYSLLEGGT